MLNRISVDHWSIDYTFCYLKFVSILAFELIKVLFKNANVLPVYANACSSEVCVTYLNES